MTQQTNDFDIFTQIQEFKLSDGKVSVKGGV